MLNRNNLIREKSFAFAIRAVNLYKHLGNKKKEVVLSRQLLRSGTAIGALVREAEQAESKPDFVHKLAIALKEANETEYWLELLHETKYLETPAFSSIQKDAVELLKLLTSIINSTKRGMDARTQEQRISG
ncbi:MAG: four helix bundle protein [Verrucomicrobiota bacterium]